MTSSTTAFSRGDLELESVPAHPRQIQQLIHQQPHAVNSVLNAFQVTLRFWRQSGAKIFGQDFGKTANVPQRRAQIVRNRVGESLQLLIRGCQLRGTLLHPLFEFFVQLADLPLVNFSLRDVTKCHHAASYGSILAFQGAAANLDPTPFLELRVA